MAAEEQHPQGTTGFPKHREFSNPFAGLAFSTYCFNL